MSKHNNSVYIQKSKSFCFRKKKRCFLQNFAIWGLCFLNYPMCLCWLSNGLNNDFHQRFTKIHQPNQIWNNINWRYIFTNTISTINKRFLDLSATLSLWNVCVFEHLNSVDFSGIRNMSEIIIISPKDFKDYSYYMSAFFTNSVVCYCFFLCRYCHRDGTGWGLLMSRHTVNW